ncbi:hypothetical protein CERSUDRAFT_69173 [Gelatoporia subvermispora B]|uniref:Uncharacterized protein n=1 Tax=Ceriporiopsis subvermispora (strain B) TaxID=914234 RepID=M2P8F7_CERS8|nr:hypothetical protein CERSUDRAFT_69173 [Gelatoporia subvermispora B]
MVDKGANYIEPDLPHGHSPPPPLSIPQTSHYYVQSQPQPSMQQTYSRPNSSFFAYGLAYPATPSASSATSSPPFSPSEYTPQYAQSHHCNASASSQQIVSPQFTRAQSHYELVKLEEGSYNTHYSLPAHTNRHSTNLPAFTAGQPTMPHWPTYSAERA